MKRRKRKPTVAVRNYKDTLFRVIFREPYFRYAGRVQQYAYGKSLKETVDQAGVECIRGGIAE